MAGILDEFLLVFKPQVQGSGFQRLNKQIKDTHSNLFSLKNLFHAFVGYDIYTGIKAIGGSLVNATKELGAMQSRFYAITNSEKLANEELQWTFELAKKTAMPLKETADSYSIFYAATQKGLGTGGARQVFQDWTEVSRVLHLSEYQFERVTYALREMASKGAIYSQDLRMQIGTHVPNAIGLAEKAANDLGFTGTEWFKKLQDSAKGNQKLINQFILLFSKYAKEMYANPKALEEAMKKPDAQIVLLKQHWDEFRYAMAQGQFGKDLVNGLIALNKTLDKLNSSQASIDRFWKLTKAIGGLLLTIGGIKFFNKIIGSKGFIKFLSGSKSVLKYIATWFINIKNLGKTAFKFLPWLLGGALKELPTLLLKSGLRIIPILNWIIIGWEVIKALWRLLQFLFPEATRWLTTWATIIWDKIIQPFKDFYNWWKSLFAKDTNFNVSQVTQPTSYDKMFQYKNLSGSPSASTVSPTFNYYNSINTEGLSTGQAINLIDQVNDKNNKQSVVIIKNGIRGSL